MLDKSLDDQTHTTEDIKEFRDKVLDELDTSVRKELRDVFRDEITDRELLNQEVEKIAAAYRTHVTDYLIKSKANTSHDIEETLRSRPFLESVGSRFNEYMFQASIKAANKKNRTVLGTLCSILFFPVKFVFLLSWLPLKWMCKLLVAIMKLGFPRLKSELDKASYQQEETSTQPSSFNNDSSNTSTSTGRSSRESKELQKPARQPMYFATTKPTGGYFSIQLRDGSKGGSIVKTYNHSGTIISGPDVAGSCINYSYKNGVIKKAVSVEIESGRTHSVLIS